MHIKKHNLSEVPMRTTVDLDEELLAAAQRVTGARTKTELIERGLQELVDRAERLDIAVEMEGSMPNIIVPRRRRM
jgi:Arc/MetJ family transcription regulator